ncbi:hypothetical protein GCM10023080_065190 [Streptomyces pseudoechinosporeus]
MEQRGARVGFSPTVMDPVDGARQNAQVRAALSPHEVARCLEQGGNMSPAEVNGLLSRLAIAHGDHGTTGGGRWPRRDGSSPADL